MLSLIHVVEWRAAVTGDQFALSSGTTGLPKLLPLTHEMLISADPAAAELIGWCRERLAHFTCPASVDVTGLLPRNATGKILKAVLRKPYWSGQERQVS